MSTVTRRTLLATLGAGMAAAAYASEEPAQRVWTPGADPREVLRARHFPDVELVTQHGKKVRLYSDLIKDRKVVINMMYTRCQGICSPVTANLANVQKRLEQHVGRDFYFYSFSLKPEEDTPAALKNFAKRHSVGRGWLFLTGTPAVMDLVRRSLRFVYDDPAEDADKSRHVGVLRLGDEAAARWSTCPARANPKHIARSIGEEFGFGYRAGTRVI